MIDHKVPEIGTLVDPLLTCQLDSSSPVRHCSGRDAVTNYDPSSREALLQKLMMSSNRNERLTAPDGIGLSVYHSGVSRCSVEHDVTQGDTNIE